MVGPVLLLGVVALAISVPVCLAMIVGGRRLGLMDPVGTEAHKKHTRPVPNTGGVAIYVSIAGPLAAVLLAAWALPAELWQRWVPAAATHLPGLRTYSGHGLLLLASVTLLHGLGLVDDRRALGPFVKLGGQLLVAGLLAGLGDVRVLMLLDQLGAGGWGLSVGLSVAWMIVVINAMNFLDNMDGLSGGVAAIVAAIYLAATLIGGEWFVAALAALLLGALVGFLVFNFPPAKIFMGDGGSLVVGLMLAVISIRTTYFPGETPGAGSAWYGVLMPLMVLAVPLYDFTSVTLVRLVQGRSPFVGDHSHFSHRLVRLGLSRRRAVGVIWLCTAATGLAGVMLPQLAPWQALIAAGQTAAVLGLLGLLEHGVGKRGV